MHTSFLPDSYLNIILAVIYLAGINVFTINALPHNYIVKYQALFSSVCSFELSTGIFILQRCLL